MTGHNDSPGSPGVFEWDDASFVCQSILFGNRPLLLLKIDIMYTNDHDCHQTGCFEECNFSS